MQAHGLFYRVVIPDGLCDEKTVFVLGDLVMRLLELGVDHPDEEFLVDGSSFFRVYFLGLLVSFDGLIVGFFFVFE